MLSAPKHEKFGNFFKNMKITSKNYKTGFTISEPVSSLSATLPYSQRLQLCSITTFRWF